MLARLVGDETDDSTKWECNKSESKGNDPFFSTHTRDLEGSSTNDAYNNLCNNLCTLKSEMMQPWEVMMN